MKVECKAIRKGSVILDATTREVIEKCASISKAKKWSWSFQRANGGLGLGSLRVESK